MNEMEIVRKIMRMFYLFRQENGMLMEHKEPLMSHRDIMMLDAIMKINPNGEPVKMNEISQYFNITPAAVSQGIKAFEKKGWVERIRLEDDRRSVYITVTKEARDHMKACAERMSENLAAFISLLGEEDAQALVRILEKGILFTKAHHNCSHKKEKGDQAC